MEIASADGSEDSGGAVYFCRCGASKTKPFCDRSHESSGFTSDKCESRIADEKMHYVGKHITIHDNRGICSHAGFCASLLPQVFHGGEPWIDPDVEAVERIKEVIELCPSGALSYSLNNVETKNLSAEEEIHITKNGPYNIRGGVEALDTNLGDDASEEHYTLCRCGDSCNKPRCDGAHWYSDFTDDEALTISAANRQREVLEPEWLRAGTLDDFGNSDKLVMNLKGRTVLLTRGSKGEGEIGAIEGVCPHQGGPLFDAPGTDMPLTGLPVNPWGKTTISRPLKLSCAKTVSLS